MGKYLSHHFLEFNTLVKNFGIQLLAVFLVRCNLDAEHPVFNSEHSN